MARARSTASRAGSSIPVTAASTVALSANGPGGGAGGGSNGSGPWTKRRRKTTGQPKKLLIRSQISGSRCCNSRTKAPEAIRPTRIPPAPPDSSPRGSINRAGLRRPARLSPTMVGHSARSRAVANPDLPASPAVRGATDSPSARHPCRLLLRVGCMPTVPGHVGCMPTVLDRNTAWATMPNRS